MSGLVSVNLLSLFSVEFVDLESPVANIALISMGGLDGPLPTSDFMEITAAIWAVSNMFLMARSWSSP